MILMRSSANILALCSSRYIVSPPFFSIVAQRSGVRKEELNSIGGERVKGKKRSSPYTDMTDEEYTEWYEKHGFHPIRWLIEDIKSDPVQYLLIPMVTSVLTVLLQPVLRELLR